jgi:hypothetical protein
MKSLFLQSLVLGLSLTPAVSLAHDADYYSFNLPDGFRVTNERTVGFDKEHGLIVAARYASGSGMSSLGVTVIVNDFGSKYSSLDAVPEKLRPHLPRAGRDQCVQIIEELDPKAKFDQDVQCKVDSAESYCAAWSAQIDGAPTQGYCVGAWHDSLISYSFMLMGTSKTLDHGGADLDAILSRIDLKPEHGISRREELIELAAP